MADRRWTAAEFEYDLPAELIAQTPAAERDASRLLVVDPTTHALRDQHFADLIALLDAEPAPPLLVLNSTRVRHARFLATRPSGRPVELLLIHPEPDGRWLAIGSPGSALRADKEIILGDGATVAIDAVRDDGMRVVRFVGLDAETAMQRYGQIPLPPYIDRTPAAEDNARYQTVYADREGSVAAPTAGLHFTTTMLDRLRHRGVRIATLDLEVGPGTFRPMSDGDVSDHPMHHEFFEIPEQLVSEVAACRARNARVWGVGTTVVRALESAAHDDGSLRAGRAATSLMITPGFRFRVVDALVTNFHLPRSTLMMLVSAFAGYDMTREAYAHAVQARYRFYSYGDAMCITHRAV